MFKSRSRFFVNTVGTHTWIVNAKPYPPAEQEIVLHLLHELPFGADRKQGFVSALPATAARAQSRDADWLSKAWRTPRRVARKRGIVISRIFHSG